MPNPISEAQRVCNREEIITLLRGTQRSGIEAVIQFMKDNGFFRYQSALMIFHKQ